MNPGRRTIRAPQDIVRQIRGLHPRLKHKVKKALAALADDPFLGKPLKYELEGLSSYRIGRFRIIYRASSKAQVEIVAIGPRREIYAETLRLLKKRGGQGT